MRSHFFIFITHPRKVTEVFLQIKSFLKDKTPSLKKSSFALVTISTELGGLRSRSVGRGEGREPPSVDSDGLGCIYALGRGRILKMKEAPLEGALCLNPRTLSARCKRVLARYPSVESQAGRVAGGVGS